MERCRYEIMDGKIYLVDPEIGLKIIEEFRLPALPKKNQKMQDREARRFECTQAVPLRKASEKSHFCASAYAWRCIRGVHI